MKTIPLTKGQVAVIDDCDFERVNQNKWSAQNSFHDKTWYAVRSIKIGGKWKHISLHRFILDAPKGMKVDHKDGDGLKNTRENLRFCTHAQNIQNMRMHNKHGYKGVTYVKKRKGKQWMAKIRVNQAPLTIGYYNTVIEAAIAYNTLAALHFGEFARLNPIPAQAGAVSS